MPDYTLPMEGGCRCDRVRFRITRPPMMTTICHCTGCQHMSASAFFTTVIVPGDGFAVIRGEPVIGGMHGDQARHHHCDWCKSWVFTRVPPELGFVNVRAGALDDPSWFVPFAETYTSEALPWAIAGAPHQFEKFPDMADYPTLLAAFAER
ncbi:MAG: GFA family protein [Sphingomonas sp.]|uniref:GFA family protein n=1 Tax=Sphingomonas sp. TaxID=28214 RepID=UPI001AD19E07|nr:GFA family protein [Sphingomonas sp.]MBN8806975.1 GFA family protein [Sphingomonas sp.]